MSPARPDLDIEKLLAPIPGESAAGQDLRYTALYDEIRKRRRTVEVKVQAEIAASNRARRVDQESDDKLRAQIAAEAAFDPGGPSLEETLASITRDTATAITKQSKDFQLAAWLLESQTRLDGFGGAAFGFDLMREMIERFWDSMFPIPDPEDDNPISNRLGLLEWVSTTIPILLRAFPLTDPAAGETWGLGDYELAGKRPDKKEENFVEEYSKERFDKLMRDSSLDHLEWVAAGLSACRVAVEAFEKITDVRCVSPQTRAGDRVSFRKIIDVIDNCRPLVEPYLTEKQIAEGKGPASAADAHDAAGASDVAADGAAPGAGGTVRRLPAGAIASREDAIARLQVIADYLAAEDATDPTPYLLSRAVAFGPLFGCNTVNEAQPLSGPATAVRTKLKALATESQSDDLLRIAEEFQRSSRKQAWLDLQRYVVNALNEKGMGLAAAAVRLQVKSLLTALPDLPEAEFEDGTPVANQETRQWLRDEGIVDAPGPVAVMRPHAAAATAPAGTGDTDAAPAAAPSVFDEAIALVQARRLPEALGKLQQYAAEAPSGRERFLRRLDLAEVCLDAGNAALAYPVLDDLAGIIERARLEDWEDRTVIVRSWFALVRCCRQLDTPESRTRGNDVFARLCRLDMSTALDLEKNASSGSARWHRR